MENSDRVRLKTCHVDGCLREVNAKGKCKRHYDLERHLRLTPGMRRVCKLDLNDKHEIRKYISCNIRLEKDCWVWTASRNCKTPPYGVKGIKNKVYTVHRLSAYAFNGFDISSKLCICHRCDNTLCVRPDHLFIGTQHDNILDMIRKGRRVKVVGEDSPFAKLRASQVTAIRKLRASGRTYAELSTMFKVGKTTIENIVKGVKWKHLLTQSENA